MTGNSRQFPIDTLCEVAAGCSVRQILSSSKSRTPLPPGVASQRVSVCHLIGRDQLEKILEGGCRPPVNPRRALHFGDDPLSEIAIMPKSFGSCSEADPNHHQQKPSKVRSLGRPPLAVRIVVEVEWPLVYGGTLSDHLLKSQRSESPGGRSRLGFAGQWNQPRSTKRKKMSGPLPLTPLASQVRR